MAYNFFIKLYLEILDDPKIYQLRVPLRWRFVECLLVAGEQRDGGYLPETKKLAWRLRDDPDKLETDLAELGDAGLLDLEDGTWRVRQFSKRQARQYSDNPEAVRKREYRKRKEEEKIKDIDIDMSLGHVPGHVPKNVPHTNIHSGSHFEHEPKERQDYITAISAIVKDTYAIGINEDKFNGVADALIDYGITIKQIESFGDWWKSNGHYQGKPALKSLVNEIRNSLPNAGKEFGANAIIFNE